MKRYAMILRMHPIFCSLRKDIQLFSRYISSKRVMASDHIDRTAESPRNEVISPATVVGMRDESKTVKSLTLRVDDDSFSFKAGQWVDMFIPGVKTVGGFSMCSSPSKLEKDRSIDLAVKYSKHPPAHWIHTQCKEGDQVNIRAGGDFFFEPAHHKDKDLLLIAGGVGINPLYSILNEIADQNKGDSSQKFSGHVKLLYSASNKEELLFQVQLCEIQDTTENISCQFHITQEGSMFGKVGNVCLLGERINKSALSSCFDWLDEEKTLVYICGPSQMIKDMETMLVQLCEIQDTTENISCQFHITQEGSMFGKVGNVCLLGERINKSALSSCFDWLDEEKTLVYICGPSQMIKDMETMLVQLCEIQDTTENISCQFHITQEGSMFGKLGNVCLLGERINKSALSSCFDWLDEEKTLVYICGPSQMIKDMENMLVSLKVDRNNIHFEKWW